MKLYYFPGACSLAAHVALIEAGLPYALVKVDLRDKRTEDGRDFAGINPKGYVPALELDDGELLTENVAVLGAIAEMGGTLTPASGLPRWRVLEMTVFISTEIHKNFRPLFVPSASDAEREAGRAALAQRLGFVSDALSARAFIVGDAMSTADCYLIVMLMWAKMHDVAVPANLSAYRDRLMQRPTVQQALREEGLA